MPTDFQALLGRGMAFIENKVPETVVLSLAPGVAVEANIGLITRKRSMAGTGYDFVEWGRVVIRRDKLVAAGIQAAPDSGQHITARGRTYRIDNCAPDPESFTIDFVALY